MKRGVTVLRNRCSLRIGAAIWTWNQNSSPLSNGGQLVSISRLFFIKCVDALIGAGIIASFGPLAQVAEQLTLNQFDYETSLSQSYQPMAP